MNSYFKLYLGRYIFLARWRVVFFRERTLIFSTASASFEMGLTGRRCRPRWLKSQTNRRPCSSHRRPSNRMTPSKCLSGTCPSKRPFEVPMFLAGLSLSVSNWGQLKVPLGVSGWKRVRTFMRLALPDDPFPNMP